MKATSLFGAALVAGLGLAEDVEMQTAALQRVALGAATMDRRHGGDALHLSNLVWASTNAKVECAAFLTHAAEVPRVLRAGACDGKIQGRTQTPAQQGALGVLKKFWLCGITTSAQCRACVQSELESV